MMASLTGAASPLILGFLLASAYAAAFHFIMGGPIRRILLYLVVAWVGFIAGQFVGDFLGIDLIKLGALHLLTASIGAWVALLLAWWLAE